MFLYKLIPIYLQAICHSIWKRPQIQLATSGDATHVEMILFVSHCPRWRNRSAESPTFLPKNRICKWTFLSNSGADLIKLFWCKFAYSFCTLYLFIPMQQILLLFIKRSSLQKSVSKFTPKKFYEIDTCGEPLTSIIFKLFTKKISSGWQEGQSRARAEDPRASGRDLQWNGQATEARW